VFGPNEYHKGDMMSLIAKNYRASLLVNRYDCSGRIGPIVPMASSAAISSTSRIASPYGVAVAAGLRRKINGVYNLGTGEARSFLDLMKAVGHACGAAPKIEFIDMPPEIRSSYQYSTQAKTNRLREIGYDAPFTALEQAVNDYVIRYLSHSDPYL
jgi:ADP-L-glycero-D-manno-heptose 6-epimerase